ncbi:hypothetical protein HNP81_004063 [Peribacillus huizhouensis]|uniref:Uncharacterized protein n=1 Tax=Peribacillus huizhouensis TaxID=1501239 RepID=A0ABR6CUP5_9BACI|nr:hypothetical protein [Peribacillus huizhouensis]
MLFNIRMKSQRFHPYIFYKDICTVGKELSMIIDLEKLVINLSI